MAEDMKRKIWGCKIGEVATARLPSGADFPMRQAVTAAYVELTGERPHFLFSGWGGSLDEGERAVVEKREPSPAFYASWLRQKHADELYEVVAELIEARDCQPGYVREHTLMKARAALAKCSPQAAQPEGK